MAENFPPSGDRIKTLVEQAIKKADVFVLIVGSRIGTLPDDRTHSYIELEYQIAKELDKPILVFMLSEEHFHKQLSLSQDKSLTDKPIRAFRDLIKNSTDQIIFFNNTDDLERNFSQTLLTFLSEWKTIPKGNSSLELSIDTNVTFENVLSKLQAVHLLYLHLCELTGVSVLRFPLIIEDLQCGSLWVKVFGESKVISLCVSLISRAVSYFHRMYTRDGMVQDIPNKLETLDTFLDLSARLEEIGIDTSELNRSLGKSAQIIASDLNTLLAGTPMLTVNDEQHLLPKNVKDITKKMS